MEITLNSTDLKQIAAEVAGIMTRHIDRVAKISETFKDRRMVPEYLTENEVQELTGIKVATLKTHRQQRRGLPYVKLGGLVRYKTKTVIDYMDSHEIVFKERQNH